MLDSGLITVNFNSDFRRAGWLINLELICAPALVGVNVISNSFAGFDSFDGRELHRRGSRFKRRKKRSPVPFVHEFVVDIHIASLVFNKMGPVTEARILYYEIPLSALHAGLRPPSAALRLSVFASYCPFFKGRHRITSLRAISRLTPVCLLLYLCGMGSQKLRFWSCRSEDATPTRRLTGFPPPWYLLPLGQRY